jgi:hypothetical protein
MARRNRVTPMGDLVADPARGLVYGNRGCLHDETGTIRRLYAVKRWIACRLEFRGWQRSELMQPGRFTELFFLDEVTALAAGHRPCALCRHEDYVRFRDLWRALHGEAGADAIDARLHAERLDEDTGARRLHALHADDLPDGTFVLSGDGPHLVLGAALLRWTPSGYTDRPPRPTGIVRVVTPPSLLALLGTDWRPSVPLFHPSASASPQPQHEVRSRPAARRRGRIPRR